MSTDEKDREELKKKVIGEVKQAISEVCLAITKCTEKPGVQVGLEMRFPTPDHVEAAELILTTMNLKYERARNVRVHGPNTLIVLHRVPHPSSK